METMQDLIEQVRIKFDIDKDERGNDSRLAGLLGISRQLMSQIKKGDIKHVNEKTAFQIAALLNRKPEEVLLILAQERASSDAVKRVWQNLLKQISRGATVMIVGMMLSAPLMQTAEYVYYVKFKRRGSDDIIDTLRA